MAGFDREDTLKKAEKLLRQGRLDGAIAEYAKVIEEQPRDWNTTNTLGDLYARAGQTDKAVAMYTRIADHLFNDGFYARAAALYKKILKLTPDEESVQLTLGEISARQGLLADAKGYFRAIAERRRARGDRAGANEMVIRLGSVDPADIEARLAAARVLSEGSEPVLAAFKYRELYADLLEKGRTDDAYAALREVVRLNPEDVDARIDLAKSAIAAGDHETARQYLDRTVAGSDPTLLLALLNLELQSGRLDTARELVPAIFEADRNLRTQVIDLAWALTPSNPDAAFVCIDTVVDASAAAGDFADAAALLQEFVARTTAQIPALLKLVEVCVDGGLESTMYETQAQLADAYIGAGKAAEARVIAEDLVAREPWEQAHIDRFRQALVMLKVSDPDTLIAERLSGQAPFMATDHFVDLGNDSAPAEQNAVAVADDPPATDAAAIHPATVVAVAPAPSPAPLPVSQPAERSEEIDLTTMLGDLQGTPPMPAPPDQPDGEKLDEVFKDFREEVSRQTGADEAEQHLKLARTFLEMDMPDEAIGSLTTAARSPRHRFEAAAMLGRLYRDQQDVPHAIEWLERAAEAPASAIEEARALLYDLGTLLEAHGENARALAVFLELQAEAGEFRDVAARVERLERVQAGG